MKFIGFNIQTPAEKRLAEEVKELKYYINKVKAEKEVLESNIAKQKIITDIQYSLLEIDSNEKRRSATDISQIVCWGLLFFLIGCTIYDYYKNNY